MWYIIVNLLSWTSQILIITLFHHPQVTLYLLKPQTLKHVEVINVSDKRTCDTSLESSWVRDHRFWTSPWLDTLGWNYTISNLKLENPMSFVEASQKREAQRSEQWYRREADWKEAGELRSGERAWILSDNTSGTSDSEGYWYYPQNPTLFASFPSFSGKSTSQVYHNGQ